MAADLGAVVPPADDLPYGGVRVEPHDLPVEAPGLLRLVDDDPVGAAPPDLERDARAGDCAGEVERAAPRPRARICSRRPSHLVACEPLQLVPVRHSVELAVTP